MEKKKRYNPNDFQRWRFTKTVTSLSDIPKTKKTTAPNKGTKLNKEKSRNKKN